MDYRTAAAIGQNISGIADAFIQMNDPRTRAQANQLRLETEGQALRNKGLTIANQFAPQQAQAGIDLDRARIGTEGSQQNYYNAGADERRTASDINRTRNAAGQEMLGAAPAGDSAASAFVPLGVAPGNPFPVFDPSIHAQVEDPYTKQFITVDRATGVPVDAQQPPAEFVTIDDGMVLPPRDDVPAASIPTAAAAFASPQPAMTPERLAILSNVFASGGADDLAQARARQAMLSAGGDEQAGRNAAAAISGQLPGVGEYSTQSAADAFQTRGLAAAKDQALAVETMQQQGLTGRKVLDLSYGGRSSGGSGSSSNGSGSPDVSGVSMVKPAHEMLASRFGMMTDDGELVVAPEMASSARAWQQTFASLVDSGVSPVAAEGIADDYHQTKQVTEEDPWFGAPRKVVGAGFNANPMTPDQARAYAPAPAAGVPPLPDLASLFGMAPAAPAPAVAPTPDAQLIRQPDAIPQTGADSPKRGKALGTEKAKAEQQQAADKGTAWNTSTIHNALRSAAAMGVPIEDLIATAFAGDAANDQAFERVISDGGNRSVGNYVVGGGADTNSMRNALRDARALQAAGIDPALVAPFLNQTTGQPLSVEDRLAKYRR